MNIWIGSVAAHLIWRKWFRLQDIIVDCSCEKLTSLAEGILQNRPYRPTFYSFLDFHGQLQTAIPFNIRNVAVILSNVVYDREIFKLSDGGNVGLDWARLSNQPPSQNDSLVIIQHGLCGHSGAEYIIHLVEKLLQENFNVVVVVARGCGGLTLSSRVGIVAGQTKDIREAINHIREKCSDRIKKFYCLGFSLGAGNFLKYLGEEGSQGSSWLSAAVCVSPPWNLAKQTLVFRLWSALLVIPLKLYVVRHLDMLRRDDISIWQVLRTRNIAEFDTILMKVNGFEELAVYYEYGSPVHVAHNIHVPTLAISAADDPVCCVTGCPSSSSSSTASSSSSSSSSSTDHANEEDTRNKDDNNKTPALGPGLCIVKTAVGGHLGFPTGVLPFKSAWTDDVIIDWFKAH